MCSCSRQEYGLESDRPFGFFPSDHRLFRNVRDLLVQCAISHVSLRHETYPRPSIGFELEYSSNMLPDELLDSYNRYKSDTAQFATWLAETARACGCKSESINRPTWKPPRSKGRGKTKGKKSAQKTHASPTTATTAEYPLALNEFSAFAKAIANFETPPVAVPLTILRIGQYAISARKRCAKWYSKQVHSGLASEQENRAHMHVVNVLEEVLDILRPRWGSMDGSGKDQAEAVLHEENGNNEISANRFKLLDSEDFLEEDFDIKQQGQNDTVKPMEPLSSSTQQHTQIRYQIESSDKDTEFAIFCLLEDLSHMRKYIRQIWQDYRSGTLDLISASVTTNTAIELMRQADQDFRAIFPQLSNYELMIHLYFPSVRERHDLRPDRRDHEQYEIFDSIFFTPFRFLADFCDSVYGPPGQQYMPTPLWGRSYDPRSDRREMSALSKLTEDVILMSEILPEFLIMFMGKMIPTADEVSVGLLTMFRTNDIHLWVCFTFQIFVDIHHTLREEVSRGYRELHSFGIRTHSSLQNFSKRFSKYPETIWPKLDREKLLCVQDTIKKWILNDALLIQRATIFGARFNAECYPGKPYGLLSQHPLACGLLMFAISLKMRQEGLRLANTSGWTRDAAHLYNAAQQERLISVPWIDMDHLIGFESTERVFVGQAPKNPQAYHQHYSLVEGVSVASFARNRRQQANIMSKRGPRGFGDSSLISGLFHKRYCIFTDEMYVTVDYLEALLAERARTPGNRFPSISSAHRSWMLLHKPSSLDVVALIKDYISVEAPKALFDHFAMHQRCFGLLMTIQSSLQSEIGGRYGKAGKYGVLAQLVLLTRILLEERADPHSELGVIWLSRVGEVMQAFLDTGGDSKGKISSVIPERVKETVNRRGWPLYPLTHVGYDRADLAGTEFELLIREPEKHPATLWGILESETYHDFSNYFENS